MDQINKRKELEQLCKTLVALKLQPKPKYQSKLDKSNVNLVDNKVLTNACNGLTGSNGGLNLST